MFSATVPKEIEKLAGTFQNDALRIVAQGESKQHVDIEYRAFSVAARDREHAIFNILRFYEAQTAIVFCKTRVNVNHLMARMGNRGFQVVALSGELSQQERTHALQALRDGRARVCIATDVAARGIDLPGLELVIHADLPSNSETLLHRSGRTGRAGKKGVSALIVAPAEFKKAQRLLQGAKVVAEWGSAPGADEVQAKDDLRILEHPALLAGLGDEAEMAQGLLDRFGAEAVAAGFVRMWRQGRSAPEVLSSDQATPPTSAPRERGEFGPSVWFRLSVGRAGRAEARWLLPKICDAGGIAKDGIGAIRVREDETFVQIAEPLAAKFGASVELDRDLLMQRIEGEPDLDRPRAPSAKFERPERREKPAYTPKPARVVEDDTAPAPRAEPAKKPYAKREDSPRPAAYAKPAWQDKPKPYAKREDGDRPRPPREDYRAPRPSGEDEAVAKKPRWSPDQKAAPRAAGFKSHGGAAGKPARAEGYKSHSSEGAGYKPKGEGFKPRSEGFKPREDGDRPARKPYAPKGDDARPFAKREGPAKSGGFKSHAAGGKKPFDKAAPRPAKPKADAKDTSKRFVPPKGPKR
jgi:ATP-dependent RNA helicase DeaD